MAMGIHGHRNARGRRAPMAEINVTPLVDVMLVLLIIFMVTAPLLVAGVPIDLPESRAGALDQQAQPLPVAIDGTGAITIDDVRVTESELPASPAQVAAQPQPAEGRRIYRRGDRSLDYGRVMA